MPDVAAKEAALHRLLAPRLPAPRVFFAAADNPISGPELTHALMAFAHREPNLGASWPGPPSLTHADFGGSPMMDLGNLLRPPLGELPGFEDAVAAGLPRSRRRLA